MYPSVIFVIHGTMISRHCVKRDVGIGSNSHVLLEEPINYFKISSFDTGLNVWRAVPVNFSYDGVKTPNESSSLRTFTFHHWKMLQIFHICHSQFQKVKVLLFSRPRRWSVTENSSLLEDIFSNFWRKYSRFIFGWWCWLCHDGSWKCDDEW